MKISAIIIAKNEEQNISRCLLSLFGCVDDVLVLLDDSTTDRTLEILNSFPAVRYEVVKWKGYSQTKQLGISKTKYDWVFWIDADEELTPELKQEIIKLKTNEPLFNSYSVARRAFFLGKWIKHCGWYPGRVVRLFNKKLIGFNNTEVHEHLNIVGEVGKLKNDLNHFTDPNLHHYFEKFNNYTSLAAKDLLKRNKEVNKQDLFIRPFFLFIKMYIFRLGFLDGIHGFILSLASVNYVFAKYAKLWELSKNKPQ
jgi:glycosyltransferase involved in cell wall biosynthesis